MTEHNNNDTDGDSSDKLLQIIQDSLEDNKAEDILVVELAKKTNIADYMVIASGLSKRHVASIAENMAQKIKQTGGQVRIEGLEQSDWVLLDAFHIIVHIFRPEVREFYELEKMWSPEVLKRGEAEV